MDVIEYDLKDLVIFSGISPEMLKVELISFWIIIDYLIQHVNMLL
jgi:hypothetical protein